MTLSPQFLDELRTRTLLSGLLGRSIKLTRAGREFRACCPFHNEKTPSFYVNDEKGFYHCFGCSAHGDAIGWMTEKLGLPFMDAVKELAATAGMEVPAADPRAAEKAERAQDLYDVMAAAAGWFQDQLGSHDGADARAYLQRRGISDQTRGDFEIGLAPDSKSRLRSALTRFGNDKLVEAGLLIQPDDRSREPYDRFRGRLMIPIRDRRGRVIAFGGRILGDGEPKYLNSPETPLFDKGRTLFNLDRAAAASRSAGRLVLVEGYMDVLALERGDIKEAVAPLGTALTDEQLDLAWRLTSSPIICFDGDTAGRKAAYRAALKALPLATPDRTLSFVTLPDGLDPDDLIQRAGPSILNRVLLKAESLFDYLWRYELTATRDITTPVGRAKLKERLQELASVVGNKALSSQFRDFFRQRFDDAFGWRPREVKRAAGAIVASKTQGQIAYQYTLMRAVLLGLSRFPEVLRENLEDVERLRLSNEHLLAWRDVLVTAVLERPLLDEDLIVAILASSEVSPITKRDITKDLAFSFFKRSNDAQRSISDLSRVVHTIIIEQSMDDELQVANERLKAEMTEAPWQAQLRSREERDRNNRHLKSFVDGEGEKQFGT